MPDSFTDAVEKALRGRANPLKGRSPLQTYNHKIGNELKKRYPLDPGTKPKTTGREKPYENFRPPGSDSFQSWVWHAKEKEWVPHSPSRVSKVYAEDPRASKELKASEGLILKRPHHPTFHKTEKGEREAGYEFVWDEDRGEYFSFPKRPHYRGPLKPRQQGGKK